MVFHSFFKIEARKILLTIFLFAVSYLYLSSLYPSLIFLPSARTSPVEYISMSYGLGVGSLMMALVVMGIFYFLALYFLSCVAVWVHDKVMHR